MASRPIRVTHVTADPEGEWYPVGRRYHLPSRFTATIDDDRWGVIVDLDVLFHPRREPICEGFTCRRREDGPAVTTELLRTLPLVRFVQAAVDVAPYRTAFTADGIQRESVLDAPESERAELIREFRRAAIEPSAAPRPRRGQPMPLEHLEEVARIYREALALRWPPTKTVAEQMGVSRDVAAGWVWRARDRGVLGKTTTTRPGESHEQS